MQYAQTSLFRMPKLFRDLLVLALIMTASCLDAMEDNVTTTTMEISTSIATSIYIDSTSMRTTTTEENTLSPSVTVTTQDDGMTKNLSHVPSLSLPDTVWECPNITEAGVECSCDFPHTLRCTGDRTALQVIEANAIAHMSYVIDTIYHIIGVAKLIIFIS